MCTIVLLCFTNSSLVYLFMIHYTCVYIQKSILSDALDRAKLSVIDGVCFCRFDVMCSEKTSSADECGTGADPDPDLDLNSSDDRKY